MTRIFDLVVVAIYLAGIAALGIWFSRRQTSTENYFVAKRSVPFWAMGMSMLATMISSVTFVAYPGSSYAKDWSLLVPGFLLLAVLPFVGKVIIPFYREEVGMSAYEYFQRRFGRPARVYAAIAFSLAHFSKMGFVLYLMALTIASMTGWPIVTVILAVAVVMVFYTVIGGIEAVVWSDVIQGFVMWIGIAVALGYLLFLPAGGPPRYSAPQLRMESFPSAVLTLTSHVPRFPWRFSTACSGMVSDTLRIRPWCSAICLQNRIGRHQRRDHGSISLCPCMGTVHAHRHLRLVILSTLRRTGPRRHHKGRPDVPLLPERSSATRSTRPIASRLDRGRDDDAGQRSQHAGDGAGRRLLSRCASSGHR